jgi:hypothetical protein
VGSLQTANQPWNKNMWKRQLFILFLNDQRLPVNDQSNEDDGL